MLGSEWLYGAIALLVGVHVLTLLYAYRRQGEPTTGTADGEAETVPTPSGETGPEAVCCGHCGAINEGGYQFCRECASDLATGSGQRLTQPNADAR